MLLEKLTIENYGVYANRSEFDLSSTIQKPIVLVGGLNGAGKTTIFESLMIALYGKTYLGRRVTKKEYLEFILQKIHRHEGKCATTASIEVAFRFYHNGSEDGYVLKRSWTREGASVTESLFIQKNQSTMSDVDESQWQSFIEELIPLGIARLFFFDGEKISKMTEWNDPDNDEVKSSLDMLLGTELIKRLYSDLNLYMVRRSDSEDNENMAIRQKYDDLYKEKEVLASEIENLDVEYQHKLAEIQELTSTVGIKESKIAAIGGGYAEIRERLLTQKAASDEKIRQQGKSIQEELAEDAPLYIVPAIMDKIKKQIESDMNIVRQKSSSSLIKDKIEKLKKEMSSKKFWSDKTYDPAIRDKITQKLDDMIEESSDEPFFDMAPNDSIRILEKIQDIPSQRKSLCGKIDEYSDVMRHLQTAESELAKSPRDDEIGQKISEINQLHQEIGILKSEISHIEQQLSSKNAYQKIIKNRLKALIDSIHKNRTTSVGIKIAAKMQNVLDTYSASLKERKIQELESNLLNATRSLLHKKHIHRIEIDRETFEIRVYENGDDENPGNLKSMGERQIIGTALLWAIARTSKRSLPFVIDTPLGRLDGKHLSNLMDRFYPFASHQLILLSTDREIGPKEYQKLSRYVSRSYRITCNENKSVTTVRDGYFMEKEIAQT